ncbi:hydrogenase expression protein HypF [Streptomyces cucumeris]|uniref:hydrogenase expression protein HypF n=1 Tax=Streptomyces cucumeris TaxID=2962890 RepID=UPI0020C89035|nr:hydrogenase expression protein HypF [Streptomyces sp. NEAU-Y11]MCP9206476.1 hydrogenase expression protein HypF [Streptomyces sp. NEAU-Y11]
MGGTVRGDEEQAEGAGARRARTGPRHAAPKKSMLTRLQVPAGKAIALAAMPTAVLMGMGLTPQLASASPRPEDRYKAGPCVSQPDEADKDAKDEKGAEDEKDEAGTKDPAGSEDPKGSGDSSGSTGNGDTPAQKPDPAPTPTEETSTPEPDPSGSASEDDDESGEPSATPSPSESDNPLDPLGLGDKLRDIFTPDDEEDEEPAEPSASPSPSESGTPTPSADPSSEKPADAVKDTVDEAGDAAKDTVDKAKKTVEDTKDEAEKATPSPSPSASESGGKDGKDAFPCPEFDADAYKNAKTDPTPSLLPDEPWTLKSSMLSLHGLDYKGIVEVKTYSGKVKKVLKFTASGIGIKDLHQTVIGPGGTTTHVQAREGSTSDIENGTVTMYTEELSGNLLGIIPITFSPESPPPLNLPEIFFTKVTVKQAGQFGGDLTIPGMRVYKTGE